MTIPSPQSPAEPGHSDMLARQERMADPLSIACKWCGTVPGNGDSACADRDTALQCTWLRGPERIRAIEAQLRYLESCNQHLRQKEISELRSELSRLRNEGGGEGKGCRTSDLELPIRSLEPKRGPAVDARNDDHTEAEEQRRQIAEGFRASPSDLPAREAIERMAREWRRWVFKRTDTRGIEMASRAAVHAFTVDEALKKTRALFPDEAWRLSRFDLEETLEPESAAPSNQPEGVRVDFDEIMKAFYDLHSAYGDRFFDKDGPSFQAAYNAADKLLGRWQRGELKTFPRGLVEAAEWPLIRGISRDADRPEQALVIHFDRRPTDDEMRNVHEALRTLSAKGGAG